MQSSPAWSSAPGWWCRPDRGSRTAAARSPVHRGPTRTSRQARRWWMWSWPAHRRRTSRPARTTGPSRRPGTWGFFSRQISPVALTRARVSNKGWSRRQTQPRRHTGGPNVARAARVSSGGGPVRGQAASMCRAASWMSWPSCCASASVKGTAPAGSAATGTKRTSPSRFSSKTRPAATWNRRVRHA